MNLDCQNINFSIRSSQQRVDVANKTLGKDVVQKILCFSLYLLGASGKSISTSLNTAPDTVKSSIKRVQQNGVAAFNDRRYKKDSVVYTKPTTNDFYSVSIKTDYVKIHVANSQKTISIPTQNKLQIKIFLLTLLDAGLITLQEVSKVLDYSTNHLQFLNKRLHDNDAYALIDKRKGQQEEFKFTPEVKSELILQFILDLANENKTSGELLSAHIKERSDIELSARSIRFHIERLGLGKIKKEVSDCLGKIKKNSSKL